MSGRTTYGRRRASIAPASPTTISASRRSHGAGAAGPAGAPGERLLLGELPLGRGDHGLRAEAELLLQLLERCRGAEGLHADRLAGGADIARPAEGGGLLDRHARGHRR